MFFNADDSIILFVKERIIQNVSEAAKNQRIAVGVSGGVDSMVLLRALIEAKKSTDFSFFIVNIEHGIRGRSSENDSRFVADFARSHGIECRTFKVDSLRRAKEFGETEEEAARVLRYGVFQKLLIDGDCDKVFLAHHEDDQAETVLMRIIRGTGIKGLSGMQKETRGYVRPLLDVSKEEILDFQKKYDVPYVVDESNFENDKTRNLIRNEIMPLLNRAGDATGSLNRLSRIAADTEEFLSTLDLPLEISKDSVGIDVKNPPVFLLKRAIRNAFWRSASKRTWKKSTSSSFSICCKKKTAQASICLTASSSRKNTTRSFFQNPSKNKPLQRRLRQVKSRFWTKP